jgi:2-C-methyl-D-erythritol 4-phosphate cytidylyltransferase
VTARLYALIPCAGTGSRSGAPMPKQYQTVGGRPMLGHTLAAFDACSEFSQTLVVLAPDDTHFDARRFAGLRFAVQRCGGASRQASVFNGLHALAEFGAKDDDWVLVHDAARPGITPELIRKLVGELRDDAVGGILALPVADTLKRIEAEGEAHSAGRIARTESRNGLWQAQTPQMFRHDMLLRALRQIEHVTDEAAAVEALGYRPKLVEGSTRNLKVTFPADMEIAERLLEDAR